LADSGAAGSGYPDGLTDADIPIVARIFQIADVFDALTSHRPYRKPLDPSDAMSTLQDEAAAGWRSCENPEQVRDAGMDPDRLEIVHRTALAFHPSPWAVAIIHRGHLTAEWYATKTFTSLAFGRLIEDSHNRRPGLSRPIALDSPAYDFVPATPPPTDPRKAGITIHQLRSMTSGIPGGDHSFTGIAAGQGASGGPFEIALGHATDRFGRSPARLYTDPGTAWDYADTAFAHLSMIFREAAGIEMSTYLDERLFKPLGITNYGWDHRAAAPIASAPAPTPTPACDSPPWTLPASVTCSSTGAYWPANRLWPRPGSSA
jgi:hypothetical protein